MKTIHAPWLCHWFGVEAITLAPFIFHRATYFGPEIPLYHHEVHHLLDQRALGLIRWLWRYATNPEFRLRKEAAALYEEAWHEAKGTKRNARRLFRLWLNHPWLRRYKLERHYTLLDARRMLKEFWR